MSLSQVLEKSIQCFFFHFIKNFTVASVESIPAICTRSSAKLLRKQIDRNRSWVAIKVAGSIVQAYTNAHQSIKWNRKWSSIFFVAAPLNREPTNYNKKFNGIYTLHARKRTEYKWMLPLSDLIYRTRLTRPKHIHTNSQCTVTYKSDRARVTHTQPN